LASKAAVYFLDTRRHLNFRKKLLPFSHFDFYSISKLWSQREIFRLYEERIYPFVLYIADRWTGIDLGGMVTGGLSATDLGDFSIIGGYVRSLTWLIRHPQFACQIFRNLSTKFFCALLSVFKILAVQFRTPLTGCGQAMQRCGLMST
jgi:hypothetical protein